MTKFDITFATYAQLPDGDPDDLLALDILKNRGYMVRTAIWNDCSVDWSESGLCVLRSTWDYHLHYADFISWVERVAAQTKLFNPIELIRWNSNKKSYMQDLANQGAPVIETVWAEKDSVVDLRQLLKRRGWGKAVIKPGVGCGTFNVKRVSNEPASLAAGQTHLDSLLHVGDAMVQPYLTAVETYGERALVFIDGQYSHATFKPAFQALLPTGQAGEQPTKATHEEIEVAAQILTLAPEKPLYARVDLVPNNEGQISLLELELVEPSLFLSMDPDLAPPLFADAIERLIAKPSLQSQCKVD